MNNQISMTDEKLIQFYLNSDPQAFATLVELNKDRVYNSIYSVVQDKHAAEEIFREVMMLNHYAGLSFKEISETLQRSLNAALDKMKFRLSNLRKLMTEQQVIMQ